MNKLKKKITFVMSAITLYFSVITFLADFENKGDLSYYQNLLSASVMALLVFFMGGFITLLLISIETD